MYDATLEMHAKTKVPNVPLAGVQNMIDALLRMNPRMAKLKAADWLTVHSSTGWKSRDTYKRP